MRADMGEKPDRDVVPLPVIEWTRTHIRNIAILRLLRAYGEAITNGGDVQPVVRDSSSQYEIIRNYLLANASASKHGWQPKHGIQPGPVPAPQVFGGSGLFAFTGLSQLAFTGSSQSAFADTGQLASAASGLPAVAGRSRPHMPDPSQRQNASRSRQPNPGPSRRAGTTTSRSASVDSLTSVATSAIVPRNEMHGLEQHLLDEDKSMSKQQACLTPLSHGASGSSAVLTVKKLGDIKTASNNLAKAIEGDPAVSIFSESEQPYIYAKRHGNYVRTRDAIGRLINQVKEQKKHKQPQGVSQQSFQDHLHNLKSVCNLLEQKLKELLAWRSLQHPLVQQWAEVAAVVRDRLRMERDMRIIQEQQELLEAELLQQDVEMGGIQQQQQDVEMTGVQPQPEDEDFYGVTSSEDDDDDDDDDDGDDGSGDETVQQPDTTNAMNLDQTLHGSAHGPGGRNERPYKPILPKESRQ